MIKLSAGVLKKIVPFISDQNLQTYTPLLNDAFIQFEINRKERVACFLSQLAHESGSFRYTKEIASGEAYEGRKDLGNIVAGDGIKFKGRGLIQVTGRNNYRDCSLYLFKDERLLTNPEILETPELALKSACWYWQSRKLNEIADKDKSWSIVLKGKLRSKFEALTIKINGGLNGYQDRLEFYKRCQSFLLES